MNRSHVGILIATGLASVALGAVSHDQPSTTPLTAEKLQVYADFIDTMSANKNFNLISNATHPFDASILEKNAPCLRDLVLQNSQDAKNTQHSLDPGILRGKPIRLVASDEEFAILKQHDSSAAAHPDPTKQFSMENTYLGVAEFSEIVFDETRRFAVLKYVLRCGLQCNSGEILVLEKVDSHWIGNTRRPCKFLPKSENPWP
jgi:hypothetical protein